MRQQEKAVIAITVAVFLVVAVVFTCIVAVFSNGFTTKFQHIYLTVGRIKYTKRSDVVLGNVKFNVK